MQIGENENFWSHWGNVEWIISGIITVGAVIVRFVWQLSHKVTLLEEREEMRDKLDAERHAENMHNIRGLRFGIEGLSARIDRWVGRSRDE